VKRFTVEQLTGALLERHQSASLEELFKLIRQKIADEQSSA